MMNSPNTIAPITATRVHKKDGIHSYPQIILSGKWLADRAFQPGATILVRCQPDYISVTNVRPLQASAFTQCTGPNGHARLVCALVPPRDEHFVLPPMPADAPTSETITKVGTTNRISCEDGFPLIRLTGPQLAAAGFTPGEKIALTATMNTVIIRNVRRVESFTYTDAPLPLTTRDHSHKTLTVSQRYVSRRGGYRRYPFLRIGGRWLTQFAFQPGEPVWIRSGLNKLTITNTAPLDAPAPNQRENRAHTDSTAHGYPYFHLSGKWLADAGFAPGQKITVTCASHTLTITNIQPVKRSGYIHRPFATYGADPSFYREGQPGKYRRHRKALIHRQRRSPGLRANLWGIRHGYLTPNSLICKTRNYGTQEV